MNKESKTYLRSAKTQSARLHEMSSLKGALYVYKTIGLGILYALISIANTMLGEKDE